MKIVIAFDSLKGALTAPETCRIVAESLAGELPDTTIVELPMADGGEGTVAALVAACNGQFIEVPEVTGPLPDMRCRGVYGWLPAQHTAVIEMAAVSGLPLLKVSERNPLKTTTYGTGQLIRHAASETGARRILLALGGSATVDGGVGAACACDWQFLDAHGDQIQPGGGNLRNIAQILPPSNNELCDIDLEVLCDVTNPLCGPNGAATVYGPQKGATPEMVRELENALRHLAFCIQEQLAVEVANIPGAGAAGGFGAGAIAFFGGELVPGIDAVAEACGLESALEDADWVITGEGQLDRQSLQGKVVDGVARRARLHNTHVGVMAGRVALAENEDKAAGLDEVIQITPEYVEREKAIAEVRQYLRLAAARLAGRIRPESV